MVCPAGDSEGLAELIQRFAKISTEERRQMGERGRAYAQVEFDRGTLVTRLLNLLEEAMSLHQQKKS